MGTGLPLLHPPWGPGLPLHTHCTPTTRPLPMLCLHLGCHPLGLTHLLPGQLMGQGQFCSTR